MGLLVHDGLGPRCDLWSAMVSGLAGDVLRCGCEQTSPRMAGTDPAHHLRPRHAESRAFDVVLLGLIVFSVLLVMLETVEELMLKYGTLLLVLEWIVTILFTIEYVARLATVDSKIRYARSFYGVVDCWRSSRCISA